MLLEVLPPEIVFHVLDLLGHLDLLRCSSVCKKLKGMVDATPSYQYTIALAAGGLVDNPASSWALSEKLDAARHHERAWRTLEYTSVHTLPSPSGNFWELYGGVWGNSVTDNSLRLYQLPSGIRRIPSREWHLALDISPRDFTFDPSQDLLVLVDELPPSPLQTAGCVVHLRTLSNGVRHPLALAAQLEFPSKWDHAGNFSYSMRVCGRRVAVLRQSPHPDLAELMVWDWRTGTVNFHLFGHYNIRSYSFLDESTVIVASLASPEDKRRYMATHSCLILYTLEGQAVVSDEDTIFKKSYLLVILLPDASLPSSARELVIYSDPAPTPTRTKCLDTPFDVDAEDRMLIVNFQVIRSQRLEMVTFALPFAHIRSALDSDSFGTTLKRKAFWDIRSHEVSGHGLWSVWVCIVYGLRYVSPRIVTNEDGKQCIRVRDFQQTRRRRASALDDTPVLEGGAFETFLTLPEDITAKRNPLTMMISEDNIIAMELGEGADRKMHIFTF